MNNHRPSPAIAGPKSARSWSIAVGGYFLASLGAVSAIIGLLKWYDVPQGAESLRPRLIISACITVLCLTAIATLVHLAVHYRRRYRVHRDRGLIRDLYPNRDRLKAHYKKVLLDSQECFRVIGISLHTLATEPDLATWIGEALTLKPDLHIHFGFMKPHSEFVRQREKTENRAIGRISHDCLRNLRRILQVKHGLGQSSERLHIHQIETFPVAFLLQRDNEIYFEPYLAKEAGRTFPTFVMARNDANAEAFDKFVRHIDDVIADGSELLEAPSDPEPVISTYGTATDRLRLRSAVFLDRDGVLVEDTGYISSPEDLRLRNGVVEALGALQREFRIIVVTNQSGVARGYFTESDLFEINNRLIAILDDHDIIIDAVYYCPHHPTEGSYPYKRECECRKPKPGMILEAARQFGIDLQHSVVVGDADRDIAAGAAAGTRSILVRSAGGMGETTTSDADGAIDTLSELPRMIRQMIKNSITSGPATES